MLKKIVIISSLRVLLIFLLLNKEKLENVYFIFENVFVENKDIKKLKIVSEKNIFKRILKKIEYYYKLKKFLKVYIQAEKVIVYGADHVDIADFFLKRYDFYLIEDGMINYSKKAYIRSLKNIIFSYPKFGRCRNVKKIYLTGLAPIPEEIENKVEIINLKELWKFKTREEKEEVLNFFGFSNNIVKSLKDRNIILYTQPLSEDEIITEKEKIELYSKIILNYPKEKLILKTHPREKTNYKDIFEEILVLEQNFPAEIFELLELNLERGVTIFSTAILNAGVKKIDFYGTEIHPKLIEKFGSMDSLIKRNKFIK